VKNVVVFHTSLKPHNVSNQPSCGRLTYFDVTPNRNRVSWFFSRQKMEYVILLFLMVFAKSSLIGLPIGFLAFIVGEALRFDHRSCVIAGVLVWVVASSVVSIGAINDGFR
jgi:hypothetical protein